MTREAASVLNLDLELKASASLSRLAKHLERSSFVLYCGAFKGSYRLCVEPMIGGCLSRSPRACTAHFLEILETLPGDLAVLFKRCSSRVFDYGFEGGLESKPLSVHISASQLARIARLGVKLRITVYPHRGGAGS
jgi:hypothetical protein